MTITASDGTVSGTSAFFDLSAPITRFTIWNPDVAVSYEATDTQAVELGVKFRADTTGYITGIRFSSTPTTLAYTPATCGQQVELI